MRVLFDKRNRIAGWTGLLLKGKHDYMINKINKMVFYEGVIGWGNKIARLT